MKFDNVQHHFIGICISGRAIHLKTSFPAGRQGVMLITVGLLELVHISI